jgi:hypothetical protein
MIAGMVPKSYEAKGFAISINSAAGQIKVTAVPLHTTNPTDRV